jgi:hypothetical protein
MTSPVHRSLIFCHQAIGTYHFCYLDKTILGYSILQPLGRTSTNSFLHTSFNICISHQDTTQNAQWTLLSRVPHDHQHTISTSRRIDGCWSGQRLRYQLHSTPSRRDTKSHPWLLHHPYVLSPTAQGTKQRSVDCYYRNVLTQDNQARKGQYPGGPKSLIYSSNVLNGGLSNREAERLAAGKRL